jgi:hypothetical protein
MDEPEMDFRAIQILSMAIATLMEELAWAPYGSQEIHTPVIATDSDCKNLELLLDIMTTLTRMLDTRIAYITTEGKVVREWIEKVLELGNRYQKELELLRKLEKEFASQQFSSQRAD